MAPRVVVVGAGYAGTALVRHLSGDPDVDLTWVSTTDYHLVKHEVHRVISSPSIADGLRIPVTDIVPSSVSFVEGRVTAVDPDEQLVSLESGTDIGYDVLAMTAGARTAYYGIPGLREHAQTLTGVEDARALHDSVVNADVDRLRVVVGGGGLTGIQIVGELHDLARSVDQDVDLTIVEALDDLLPHGAPALRSRIEDAFEARSVRTVTGSPIVEATADGVLLEGERELPWDLLVWSGGITGNEIELGGLETARSRIAADATLLSSDPRVFALGDAAVVEQPDGFAPPTAQAAWQAAPAAAANIRATIAGNPLEPWAFESKGTLISVGEEAFAHGVTGVPVDTIGSYPASFLKKMVAARWIADVDSWSRAVRLWGAL